MQRDAKFLAYLPSQLAAASLMMAINLTQARESERKSLNLRYTSSDQLTEIVKETTKCNDIQIGVTNIKPEFGFLCYPVAWCQHIEELTGLKKK